jgi:hypothetical protein
MTAAMTIAARPVSRAHHVLTEARCRELLASRHEGRSAWTPPDGLQMLPVSHALHEGEVAFRTSSISGRTIEAPDAD